MLYVNINYPNRYLTIHGDPQCHDIERAKEGGRRLCIINTATISQELQRLSEGYYRLGSQQGLNGLWIEVDFEDKDFERAVIDYARRLLGHRYIPLADAPIRNHC